MLPAVLDIATTVLKAIAILMLVRIAVVDFTTQKIRNEQVLQILAVALGILVLNFVRTGDSWAATVAVSMAAGLFVVLLGFWLGRKLGAGDVKLLAIMPLLVGVSGSMPFMLALLVFSWITYGVAKFPMVLPERWFREYIKSLASTGRVPFGVPISAAAIVAILISGALSAQHGAFGP